MIEKLGKRIFLILVISLSAVIVGTIFLFAIIDYSNTIETSTLMLDRFVFDLGKKVLVEQEKDNKVYYEFEDVYHFYVENGKIINISNTEVEAQIAKYAFKISNGKSDKGVIGNYIYKVRNIRNAKNIIIMKNESIAKHVRIIFLNAALWSIFAVLFIYIVSKKVTKILVKPIYDTFDKQREFISDASHELKTPLAVIKANTDVLEEEISNNKWINYIQSEIESMNNLINELLLLAKIENVDEIREYKEVNLSEKVKIVSSMFESMAYEKKVIIENNIEENVVMNCSSEDIEHILSTLIDNAIKHTFEEGHVFIELSKEKNNIQIQVKNMGEEIPVEEREKIFERFYRIDKSRNRSAKRYGLGLAIAKSTVKKYNGTINVECKDGITSFKVNLPI